MDLEGLTLNAGCGVKAWGDLRVDIQTFSSIYYRKKTSVNLVGSIEYLPFRSGVFDTTRCYHVLEHVEHPFKCVFELKRVTKGWIHIRVPVNHLYSFIIDSITLLKSFLLVPFVGTAYFEDIVYKVRSWKLRYTGHKWYIRGRKINRVYFLFPLEYVIKIKGGLRGP
jgi:hypothetical protein